MHAISILHRTLVSECSSMHAKRRECLVAAVQSAIAGHHLSVSELGRGLSGAVAIKHNIKRVDRLLGNVHLHSELIDVYASLARRHLAGVRTPLIVVDWSDLSEDRRWQLLRASVALDGRSVTLYEEVHPLSRLAAPGVHARFVARLAAMLPDACEPIVITDAGFRSPWFKLLNQYGWHWIGRIRNRDMVRREGSERWKGCKALYAQATNVAQALGSYDYVRSNPVSCDLVLIERAKQNRHSKSVFGTKAQSAHSLKQARAQSEPWLLAVSPSLSHLSAQAVVAVYAQRMQIEESFRDLKSERFGLGLHASGTKQAHRLCILLLIGALALFVLRLIGEVAKARQLQFEFQSNTRRSRAVLSVITLGRQLVQKGRDQFPAAQFNAALDRLGQTHHALQI